MILIIQAKSLKQWLNQYLLIKCYNIREWTNSIVLHSTVSDLKYTMTHLSGAVGRVALLYHVYYNEANKLGKEEYVMMMKCCDYLVGGIHSTTAMIDHANIAQPRKWHSLSHAIMI